MALEGIRGNIPRGAYDYRPRVSTEGIPRIPYKASGLTNL